MRLLKSLLRAFSFIGFVLLTTFVFYLCFLFLSPTTAFAALFIYIGLCFTIIDFYMD